MKTRKKHILSRAVSNENVCDTVFDTVDFTGDWLASFGKPELRGTWFIWSGSGAGKTTFALQLSKYLTSFGKVAYNSLEQGLSASLVIAWNRVNMSEAGSNIVLLNKELLPELKERLRIRKSPNIIIIDSLMCLVGFSRRDYLALINEFPNKLFVFLCHEKNGLPDPVIGETIRRLADVKIHIQGFVANVTSRFEREELGEGGSPYVIWQEGADKYRHTFS